MTIFPSYARGDNEPFVMRLCDDLRATRFDVWFGRVSMPSRRLTFHQEIRDAIAARDRLVLVIGPTAVPSAYVTQKWQFVWREADKGVTPNAFGSILSLCDRLTGTRNHETDEKTRKNRPHNDREKRVTLGSDQKEHAKQRDVETRCGRSARLAEDLSLSRDSRRLGQALIGLPRFVHFVTFVVVDSSPGTN
jgi:TIR domain